MAKKIDSIKHPKEKRVHIPSKEEAGYEDANPVVSEGKKIYEVPKNPVVHRGQDPELFWMNKYGNDDRDDLLKVDIRSLYRHEHIAPETLMKNLYRVVEEKKDQYDMFNVNELFGNALEKEEIEKVSDYYKHQDGWTNRLIQGDSLLVMTSLLEREGMAGKVQTIYFDPPYGIKYGSNWQVKLNNRNVKDGDDDSLAGEPEVIKAYRDSWELGIHSYLSYLRNRLLIAREILSEKGSLFLQISDENVHLIRNVLDEVFGSRNFISEIPFRKTVGATSSLIPVVNDYLVWYCKDITKVKYRKLFRPKDIQDRDKKFTWYEESPNKLRKINEEDFESFDPSRIIALDDMTSQEATKTGAFEVKFEYHSFFPASNRHWRTTERGIAKLMEQNRIYSNGKSILYKRYLSDQLFSEQGNFWFDTVNSFEGKEYVVQTNSIVIQRCILMTSDPGDLIFDPTCGSGTTAYVAEQWGRRWITIDTSRIALNIAKQRIMSAVFPDYYLYSDVNAEYKKDRNGKLKAEVKEKPESEQSHDVRLGFVYQKVPHITLKSLANDEPPDTETLFDKPVENKKKLRVSGPFTVETLQNFEPVSPEEIDSAEKADMTSGNFEEVIKEHLLSAGVKNGRKEEQVVFSRVEMLSDVYLHAEGFYSDKQGEKKAYFHIGPKFGTVSRLAVNEAIKDCRNKGDANWLVILGFSFESDIEGSTQTTSMGHFEVTKARIHDDLLQDGLKKKPSKMAASFVTIGEPDVELNCLNYDSQDEMINMIKKYKGKGGEIYESNSSKKNKGTKKDAKPKSEPELPKVQVEIKGLDIYDPINDTMKPRDVHDIAYWMVDDDYDGSNFVVKQVFFCGGDKDEFNKWKKGLDNLAKETTRRNVERTLKIEIDEEAFDRLYGHLSHPIEIKSPDQKIAVRLISLYGEESMRVMRVGEGKS